jgi:hypothetical protein
MEKIITVLLVLSAIVTLWSVTIGGALYVG